MPLPLASAPIPLPRSYMRPLSQVAPVVIPAGKAVLWSLDRIPRGPSWISVNIHSLSIWINYITYLSTKRWEAETFDRAGVTNTSPHHKSYRSSDIDLLSEGHLLNELVSLLIRSCPGRSPSALWCRIVWRAVEWIFALALHELNRARGGHRKRQHEKSE